MLQGQNLAGTILAALPVLRPLSLEDPGPYIRAEARLALCACV